MKAAFEAAPAHAAVPALAPAEPAAPATPAEGESSKFIIYYFYLFEIL